METAAAVEIGKVAFGDLFLTISTAAWKSLRTKRSAFPQLPQALRPLTIKRDHSQFPCLTEGVQSSSIPNFQFPSETNSRLAPSYEN